MWFWYIPLFLMISCALYEAWLLWKDRAWWSSGYRWTLWLFGIAVQCVGITLCAWILWGNAVEIYILRAGGGAALLVSLFVIVHWIDTSARQ